MPGGHQPGAPVQRLVQVMLPAQHPLIGQQAHPRRQRPGHLPPVLRAQLLLRRQHRADRIAGRGEHRGHPVAHRGEHHAVMRFDRPPHDRVMPRQRVPHLRRVRLPPARGPLQVGKQERHRSLRQPHRRRSLSRGRHRAARHRRRGGQRRVIGQHLRLQPGQLRPRIQAQLPGQHPPRRLERRQRLPPPPAPVQRGHQQGRQPLPQRELGHQPGQLPGHLAVPAQRQVTPDPLLGHGQPRLLQPRRLPGQPPAQRRRIRQRRPPPHPQSLPQQLPRPRRVPSPRRLPAQTGQVPEHRDVQPPRAQRQPVPGPGPGQPRPALARLQHGQPPPQLIHQRVQIPLPPRRPLLPPQPVHQRLSGHYPALGHPQQPHQHPQPRLRHRRHHPARRADLHRAQQGHRHAASRIPAHNRHRKSATPGPPPRGTPHDPAATAGPYPRKPGRLTLAPESAADPGPGLPGMTGRASSSAAW